MLPLAVMVTLGAAPDRRKAQDNHTQLKPAILSNVARFFELRAKCSLGPFVYKGISTMFACLTHDRRWPRLQ